MAKGDPLNFAGWVPVRREILRHIVLGHLTLTEWAVLHVLLLLADSGSGSGIVNGPLVRFYLPNLSKNASKRVLLSLEEKGYIYREIVPHAPHAYQFWVNRYYITTGPRRRSRVDLSKVFVTKEVKDIKYVPADLESEPEGELGGEPEDGQVGGPVGEHSNKKEKDKDKENSHTHTKAGSSLPSVSGSRIETTATPNPGAGRGSPNVDSEPMAEPAGLDAEIAGIPTYRLAELYASLSGRTTGTAQSLQQWARQLQPAVQTFDAEKLTAALTWALKDDPQRWTSIGNDHEPDEGGVEGQVWRVTGMAHLSGSGESWKRWPGAHFSAL